MKKRKQPKAKHSIIAPVVQRTLVSGNPDFSIQELAYPSPRKPQPTKAVKNKKSAARRTADLEALQLRRKKESEVRKQERILREQRELARKQERLQSLLKPQNQRPENTPALSAPKPAVISHVQLKDMERGVTLIVFRQFNSIRCNVQKHQTVKVRANIPLADGLQENVPIIFCQTCGRYFIHIDVLKLYTNSSLWDVEFQCEKEADSPNIELNPMSQLYSHGYSVNARNGMSRAQRQQLLVTLVEDGSMQYKDIVRDLTNAIHMHRSLSNNQRAVQEWEADLKFISDYSDNSSLLNF